MSALADAPLHALSPEPFLAAISQGGGDDTAFEGVALAYATALAIGAVDPTDLFEIFTLERATAPTSSDVSRARLSGELRAWLHQLAPAETGYAQLANGYRELAARPPAEEIPDGETIRLGAVDPRVPAIRAALAREGIETTGRGSAQRYTSDIADAVAVFQAGRGLTADRLVGPATVEALNLGPRDRARQIATNLERRRWLSRSPPPTRIEVNLPEARLRYFRNGSLVWNTPVVVGSPRFPTPQLEVSFTRLVVNPPWHVPTSIADREILPKGSAYLRRNNMVMRDGRIIQMPGPTAALGAVKFDMQNPYAIYLHDTPAKGLFARSERFRSHGCVRVGEAVDFARRLASERGRGDAFERALASGETEVVDLGEAIPVRLLYQSAWHTSDGTVRFRRDVYGWDDRVGRRLGLGPDRVRARAPALREMLGP